MKCIHLTVVMQALLFLHMNYGIVIILLVVSAMLVSITLSAFKNVYTYLLYFTLLQTGYSGPFCELSEFLSLSLSSLSLPYILYLHILYK
jgi:hypothetical protein